MKIEIKIDENCVEPKVLIVTDKVTDGINEIVKRLSGGQSQTIAGFQGGQVVVLEPEEIVRIYAANGYTRRQNRGPIFFGCVCMKWNSVSQTSLSCAYQTGRSST